MVTRSRKSSNRDNSMSWRPPRRHFRGMFCRGPPRCSGGAMASDVVGYELTENGLQFDCPQYAGAVLTTVQLVGTPQIVTVRSSAFVPTAARDSTDHPVERLNFAADVLSSRCRYIGLKSQKTNRPDVVEARVVVAGGRAVKSKEDFESLVGPFGRCSRRRGRHDPGVG